MKLAGLPPIAAASIAYRWVPGLSIIEHDGESLLVGATMVWKVPETLREVAESLEEWRTESELLSGVAHDQIITVLAGLRRWSAGGTVVQELRDSSGSPLIRVRQVDGTLLQDARERYGRVRLSRFTVMRQDGNELVIEQPAGNTVVNCIDPRVAMLAARLASGATVDELLDLGLDADDVARIIACFVVGEIAQEVNSDGKLAEEEDPRLRPWAWHDVAVHFRSRRGKHRYSAHGSYHLSEKQAPEPGLKGPMSTTIVPLPVVDIDALRSSDTSLTTAIEDRFAGRDYADEPLTIEQLSELLFRSSRVRWFSGQAEDLPYDHTSRPYPTGGATYDLELYLTIANCAGIEPGFYHYDPDKHALEFLSPPTPATEQLLTDAHYATAGQASPQVLITVASRFARISWKYEGMAYATTLRNVGVFYQTVWLIATAMGIACCPLGGGDAAAFAAASGLDPMKESNVGEISLGAMAADGSRGNRALIARQGAWSERV